jgi:hypothetical protein
MSTTTYGGVVREIPLLPFPIAPTSALVHGMVAEDAMTVSIYCGKGCSVLIKCAVGIIPNPGDLLYFSATLGSVTNVASGAAVAKSIGTGINGFVEAVLI